MTPEEDNDTIRAKYRPFLLDAETSSSDWISELELETVTQMAEEDLFKTRSRLKVLVLYGSLRKRCVSQAASSWNLFWIDP
jgi:arsenic resistance protein ArsH